MSVTWAVARNLLIEVVRMRVLMVLFVLITASYTVGLALWLYGDAGQADEKVQTFLSYSLSFGASFLSLLTIFLSVGTIAGDIKRKEIFTIATKPVSRGRFLLGKFLGLALLSLVMVALTGVVIYGLARLGQRTEPTSEIERAKLDELVFVARQGVKPPAPDVTAAVAKKVEEVVASKILHEAIYRNNPALIATMRSSLAKRFEEDFIYLDNSVAPGGHKTWHFRNIKPIDGAEGLVYIRYKQDVSHNPRDLATVGEWLFGREDPLLAGGQRRLTKDSINTVHEFGVSASNLSASGDLYVTYRNPTVNGHIVVIFPPESGIEVLYVAGGFEANFVRTIGLIYLRLVLLGVCGLALGAWLSFPVAALLLMVTFMMGLSSNFILGALEWEAGAAQSQISRLIMYILPSYSAYDPVPLIEKGRIVSFDIWENLRLTLGALGQGRWVGAEISQKLLVLKDILVGALVGLFGYLVFKFRELARVTV